MREKQTLVELKTIVNLQLPDYDEKLSNFPNKDKIKFRRDRINRLKKRGLKNEEISRKIGCSLSTVEKDLQDIRELSRKWYENESISDFCQSLQDSIILCDNAIEDLQILQSEYDDLDSKLKILSNISDFEEKKISLYSHTQGVQKYLQSCNLTKTGVVMCE